MSGQNENIGLIDYYQYWGKRSKYMATVTTAEIISLTANYSGYTQQAVKDILTAYTEVLVTLLKNGFESKLMNLGKFKLREMEAKEERDFKLPQTGEVIRLDATPAYKKPYFSFTPSKYSEIREATEGDML